MPYRKRTIATRKKYVPRKVAPKPKFKASQLQVAIKRELSKNIETKQSNYTSTDNIQIGHNDFVVLDNAPLMTNNGTSDPATSSSTNRIGDEINLKGVAFKVMLENNHRYSDTTFRIMVVKAAKGDTPTTATLFNGLSGNKMMDTFNNERFTLLFTKYVKIKQATAGGDGALGATYTGSGLYDGDASLTQSASTKIVKFWVPGTKFNRGGKIRYENGASQVKFFDYWVLVYAYAVGATSSALGWQVGLVNDYVRVAYFKDA